MVIIDSIALIEIFLGLLVNGFITATKLTDWWDCRKMKPFDKLFLCLGLSRFFSMWFCIFNIINRFFSLNVYHIEVLNWMLNTVCLFLDFSGLWFTMWLCFLYYVKITIFNNAFLICIKIRISELVLYMILSSVIISFLSGFVFSYNFSNTLDIMIPQSNMENNQSVEKYLKFAIPSYFFGHFLPFITVSFSAFFLIQTIFVHVNHIKRNSGGYTTPSMTAHHLAIRSIIVLEVLTVFNLIVSILSYFDFYEICNNEVLFLFVIAYPTFHSIALIIGNMRLKRSALRLFYHCKDCAIVKNHSID
ncbi:taste receptor type 2 member 40-like [Anomaloglossus baeobatrachus]|uniref:taste receptor type 2 member 40-like n=1 Tax=Anomaloglossus baeobatrachus TaxID=238106 RepID=UPI003F50D2A3